MWSVNALAYQQDSKILLAGRADDLANPGSADARVLLRFLRTDGTIVPYFAFVPAHQHVTVVTNTITGSVPGARAGMASGMDMSARLITLAINIALMGFVLLEGVHAHLRGALSASLDAPRLRALAERVAAGSFTSLGEAFPALSQADPSGTAVHAALVHGFGLVMLYGGVGVWVLAGVSWLVFGSGSKPSTRPAPESGKPACP